MTMTYDTRLTTLIEPQKRLGLSFVEHLITLIAERTAIAVLHT